MAFLLVPVGALRGEDCNVNGIDDALDVSTGTSDDCNLDGIPDECDLPDAAKVFGAPIPFRNKLEAAAHLTGNTGYPLVLLLSVLLPLSITQQTRFGGALHLVIFSLCTLSVIAFYDTSQRALGRRLKDRWIDVLSAMSLGIGMCVSQTFWMWRTP